MTAIGLVVLAVTSRRDRGRAPRGEVAWITAELAAMATPVGVWSVTLGRGGDVAADVVARLVAAGAGYVARSGRRLIVAEPTSGWLTGQVVVAGAGWITSVRPWRAPAPFEHGAVVVIDRGRVIAGGATDDGATLDRVWRVVLAHAAGRASREGRARIDSMRRGEARAWQVTLRSSTESAAP